MKLTIERIRAILLSAAVLLIVALAGFLIRGKWHNPFNPKDLPHKLGIDIQQEANGVTYTQSHAGHTLFKMHASKVVQMKEGTALLHDVKIELYGEDGSRVDRIEGDEFEYNQKDQIARATGPVEIFLMRPGAKLAVAPNAETITSATKGKPLAVAAQTAETGAIHVKTSGLVFDQKSGKATTSERVTFTLVQARGSSIGANFDSNNGTLELDRSVEITTMRDGNAVALHAEHAEFTRNDLICLLHGTTMDYKSGQVTAGDAKVLFREDGSAVRVDASNGFALASTTGSRIASPIGTLDFDDHNQPRHGHMQDGVTLDSTSQTNSTTRIMHGTSPSADMEFTSLGKLQHAHLERGVNLQSEVQGAVKMSRTWRSAVMDLDFRTVGQGRVEASALHGTGGVTITSSSQRGNDPVLPSRMSADDVTGSFGSNNVLTSMTGTGHAVMEDTTATGARQTMTGDRLVEHFAPPPSAAQKSKTAGLSAESRVQNATLDGQVVLVEQQQLARPGSSVPDSLRATAGHAQYESQGQWVHLTQTPRVEDRGLQLTGDMIDVSQDSGDAFVHGNVKATWQNPGPVDSHAAKSNPAAIGALGPSHIISSQAQMRQATDEVTFRGRARLWQDANSVNAPTIILNRQKQTLVATTDNVSDPVRAILVNAKDNTKNKSSANAGPSVVQLLGGSLRYSDAEHKAVMHSGILHTVTAQTATATSASNDVEVILLPPGNHAGKNGEASQVDHMIASGHVVVSSQGRRGTGEKLIYSSDTGEYVLTGTAASLPKMVDPVRGTVTGDAIIFNGNDDSIRTEGHGQRTKTDTIAPK